MSQPSELELARERATFFDSLAGFDEGDLRAFLPPNARQNPAAMPTLQKGAKGEAVRQLQNQLIKRGAKIKADGDFGPATDAAVRTFQAQVGLSAKNGVVDSVTWLALEAAAKGGLSEATQVAAQATKAEGTKKKGAQVVGFFKEHGGDIASTIGQLFGPKLQVPAGSMPDMMVIPPPEEEKGWGAMQWGLLVGGVAVVGIAGFFAIRALRKPKEESE
jgi:peptidoglycan hydrolase-like protein with peptidoglycan-binding domain